MARPSLLTRLSGDHPSLDQVWSWYQFQDDLVDAEQTRTLSSLVQGMPFDDPRYLSKTWNELIVFFGDQRAELDRLAMLSLLAATEAAIRVDYVKRIAAKKKNPISIEFAALFKRFGLNVSLEDQILSVWKQHSSRETKQAIGAFNGTLNLRHWLAHGRYWKPQLGQDYNVQIVFTICRTLLSLMTEPTSEIGS